MSLMESDDDTEPPMDGPDASDGDGADASDAGEPRLLESSHRAVSDGLCDSLTDQQRDDVMKIVPRMVEGPWVAKHAVGQKPALLGHAITTAYHSGPGWFEMDVDVSSSSTAAGALRILKSCSKSLVMDLAFVLEGQSEEALPEKILGTVEWNHFDLDPDNSPVIKVCAEDN